MNTSTLTPPRSSRPAGKLRKALLAIALVGATVAGGVAVASPAQAAPSQVSGRCIDTRVEQGNFNSCVGYIQRIVGGIGVDNDFGPGTRAAVVNFQRGRSISADGIVGPDTWSQLCRAGRASGSSTVRSAASAAGCGASAAAPVQAANSCVTHTYSRGSYSACVGYIQRIIGGIGVDKDFGPATYWAVRGFQSRNGISSDGIVGPDTWRQLCKAGRYSLPAISAGCRW